MSEATQEQAPEPVTGERFAREDWYADELAGRRYVECEFHEVDLTEAVVSGSVFTDCVFGNVRFNAARITDSAFTGCAFKRCNFFDAEFVRCKLVGSTFSECSMRPLTVTRGDWSFVGLPGADLRDVTFEQV